MSFSLRHEMVLCGQRDAFRLHYLRERLHDKLWTAGRVDGRGGLQEQSQLNQSYWALRL